MNRPGRIGTVMCTRARYHYGAVTEGARHPVPSAPTSPTTHVIHHLKRRAHSTRSAATIATIKWSGSFLSKDNPPRDRSQELESRPSKGAIIAPI
jgi:hypothetical protein